MQQLDLLVPFRVDLARRRIPGWNPVSRQDTVLDQLEQVLEETHVKWSLVDAPSNADEESNRLVFDLRTVSLLSPLLSAHMKHVLSIPSPHHSLVNQDMRDLSSARSGARRDDNQSLALRLYS